MDTASFVRLIAALVTTRRRLLAGLLPLIGILATLRQAEGHERRAEQEFWADESNFVYFVSDPDTAHATQIHWTDRSGGLILDYHGRAAATPGRTARSATRPACRRAPSPRPYKKRVYHGSPKLDLTYIAENPSERRGKSSSKSFLGGFFSADRNHAKGYARITEGQLYEASLHLKKPFHMDYNAFRTLDGNGRRDRVEQIKQFKSELLAEGYDGIVTHLHDPRGRFERLMESGLSVTLDPLLRKMAKTFPATRGLAKSMHSNGWRYKHAPEIVAFRDVPVWPVKGCSFAAGA
jgi:ADP-Ribosyltransferase in polyvalent proteins